MQLLRRRLHKAGVRLLDHSPAFKLLLSCGEVVGAQGLTRAGVPWTVQSGAVVIATGGCAFMSRALGTYGLTGDGLLMAVEAGAALSGMEFSGQYGISHAHATVTKNLIYDWATFSDETGQELTGGDVFEIIARNLPLDPSTLLSTRRRRRSRKDCAEASPTFFFLLTEWDRSVSAALSSHAAVRRNGSRRRRLAIDPDCAATASGPLRRRRRCVARVRRRSGERRRRPELDLGDRVRRLGGRGGLEPRGAQSRARGRSTCRARRTSRPTSKWRSRRRRMRRRPSRPSSRRLMFPLERNFIRDGMTMRQFAEPVRRRLARICDG